MRVLLQRVTSGAVEVGGQCVGAVDAGLVALVGITHEDNAAIVDAMAQKVVHVRVFDDEDGKMNRSVLDVQGGVLVVSQFTLYANARSGRRPDYMQAARPEHAEPLVTRFVEQVRQAGVVQVSTGVFGAMMQVTIHNDGPVTLWLDSATLAQQP